MCAKAFSEKSENAGIQKMAIRPLFSAACETCTTSFGYPSLGDFAYGSSIFSSTDGRRFAYVEALSPFPSRLSALLKATGSRLQFWDALARLADQSDGGQWVTGIRCPRCGSDKIASWHGTRCGEAEVPEVTFNGAAALTDPEVRDRLRAA